MHTDQESAEGEWPQSSRRRKALNNDLKIINVTDSEANRITNERFGLMAQ